MIPHTLCAVFLYLKGKYKMVNIGIVGCNGKMGHFVADAVSQNPETKAFLGVDAFGESNYDFPVFKTFTEIKEKPNAIIDFSNPAVLDDMLEYALENSVPCVICTTGYSTEQVNKIKSASEKIAIFYSGNMSLGINLLIELTKEAAKVLGNSFDIEIVEKHHNLKLDAPSGTALMIADGISDVLMKNHSMFSRHSEKAFKNEIGIHSVRGGTIVGEHELFCRSRRVITVSHQAQSSFAVGAVNAAVFLTPQKPGIYNMGNLLSDKMG